MRTNALLAVLFVSILVVNAAPDDDFLHPHRNPLSLADGVLSGIEFSHTTIDAVIAKLGKPGAVKTLRTATEGTFIFAERSYEWRREECLLRVVVAQSPGRNTIESMDVWGTYPSGEIGTTGRGLKLGDSIRDARRIYGLRSYFGVTLPEKSSPLLFPNSCPLGPEPILGRGPEPILSVDFDKAGRINHMTGTLLATVCY